MNASPPLAFSIVGLSWTAPKQRQNRGFTLIELLAVMAIMIILIGLITPALIPLKNSKDVTAAAYDLSGVLETARTYAMANNTYVWVGFYEQNYGNTSAPSAAAKPPYAGVGHLTVGSVYSTDGTNLASEVTADNPTLPAASLGQIGSLTQIYAVHLEALPQPDKANSTDPALASTLAGRPYQTDLTATQLEPTLISSTSSDTTSEPFIAQGYTFYKTIRFNPRGEANVNSTDAVTRIVELGLQPTHGNVVDNVTPNLVAVQLTGIGGAITIYRK